MARIDFKNYDISMEDLKGTHESGWGKNNPYTIDRLNDDMFNFFSGANWALSYLANLYLDNRDYFENFDNEEVNNLFPEISEKIIEDYKFLGYNEIGEFIKEAIESGGFNNE